MSPALLEVLRRQKNTYTKAMYESSELGQERNTFNWPYDYCSLVELSKLTTTTGFRPELKSEILNTQEQNIGLDLRRQLGDSDLQQMGTNIGQQNRDRE